MPERFVRFLETGERQERMPDSVMASLSFRIEQCQSQRFVLQQLQLLDGEVDVVVELRMERVLRFPRTLNDFGRSRKAAPLAAAGRPLRHDRQLHDGVVELAASFRRQVAGVIQINSQPFLLVVVTRGERDQTKN